MTHFRAGLILVALGLTALTACGTGAKAGCTPANCNGCCEGTVCKPGTVSSACGSNANACTTCGTTEQCRVGRCSSLGVGGGDPGVGGGDPGVGGGGEIAVGGGVGGSGGTGGATGGGVGGGSAGGGTGGSGGGSGGGTAGGTGGAGGGTPPPLDAGIYNSAIYFQGDYLKDGTANLGRHLFPQNAHEDLVGNRVFTVAVAPNGRKLAFCGELEQAGRTDLYVSAANGQAATKLVQQVSCTQVGFSPDGLKLALLGSVAGGAREIYVVPVAGGTPAKATPARVTGGSTTSLLPTAFAWSRDSRRLAMVADYEVNGVFQLYLYDSLNPTVAPVTVTTAAEAGANSGLTRNLGWAASGRVFFVARFSTDPASRLYSCDSTGGARIAYSSLLTVTTLGISPDGQSLVISSNLNDAGYELYVAPAATPTATARISSGTNLGGKGPSASQLLVYSPDGTRVATIADWTLSNQFELYSVPSTGGGEVRLFPLKSDAGNLDVDLFAWSPDSKELAVVGTVKDPLKAEAYRLPSASMANQTGTLISSPVDGGNLQELIWSP